MKQQPGSAGSMLATTLHVPTFLLGIVVLLYIASFVVFAIIRIVTGISIQRLGYLSLKRISYEPKDGIRIDVRKLGLLFHRPTYAQPSLVSFVIADSQVTVDLRAKFVGKDGGGSKQNAGSAGARGKAAQENLGSNQEKGKKSFLEDSQKIKRITEKTRRLIKYLKLVDVVFTNATLAVIDVGSVQIGSVTLSVDTRKDAADRSRLFDHCKALKPYQKPLELMITTRSVLFTPDKKDSKEVMDYFIFNAYGVLEEGIDGIRDSAMAVKFGRINVPCDEVMSCLQKFKQMKDPKGQRLKKTKLEKSLGALMEELSLPGSRTERMAEAVMEWRVLLRSLLEGVKEVQLAIGHLVVSKEVQSVQPAGRPLVMSVVMKELGVDLHRLDQKSPAHQMYFSPQDLAHQALLAAISISVSIDDGRGNEDKLLYMPMVTMTSRTTVPAKIIQLVEKSDSDRNTNILYATVVVTSPSVDLEPRHLPLVMAMLQSKPKRMKSGTERTQLISRLLPKASIKFSIHEPVIRIVLPARCSRDREIGSIDMLISSFSSISADIEASHSTEDGHSHYSLTSSLRVAAHNFYYQSSARERHDLLQTETLDVRVQVHATPVVHVNATAYLDTFLIRLVKPEIVHGIKQMVAQFHRHVKPDKLRSSEKSEKPNFLRRFPLWLQQFKVEGRDFSVEIAGTDPDISDVVRGAAIVLDTWVIDYKCQRHEAPIKPLGRRRAASRALSPEESLGQMLHTRHFKSPTDGRKIGFNLQGLECFKVEDNLWEQDAFLVLPVVDLSFSTSTESEGPAMSINASMKTILLDYSLSRHYCVIVAAKVLKETFTDAKVPRSPPRSPSRSPLVGPKINFMPSRSQEPKPLNVLGNFGLEMMESPLTQPEFISIDVQVEHFQAKAMFANDSALMFETFGLEAGRQKWGFPYLKAKGMRLYADSPTVKGSWARLVSLRNMQMNLREVKRRVGSAAVDESSIDLTAEAIRLAIPHQFILYKLTDNVINAAKASQQMHHRFKTGTNEYVLEKGPEGPKKIPRITLRSKALLFELEDDPFETQLGLIYRIGLLEQKMRLAREAAFDAKVQKIRDNEQRMTAEFAATRSATGTTFAEQRSRFRGRSKTMKAETQTPHKPARASRRQDPDAEEFSKRHMRYDPESATGPSEMAAVPIEQARKKLQEHNSATWIRRIKWAMEQQAMGISEKRKAFWGDDEMPSEIGETEPILSLPNRPSLMAAYVHDVDLIVDKPSFPLSELSRFMYRVGKGLPEGTKFSLLIPISLQLDFSEVKILLRDYPLPFVHIPQMRSDQTTRAPSASLKADLIIAEEFRDAQSMRHVRVDIAPPLIATNMPRKGFAIDVRRTVSAVKSYSDIDVAINTAYATRITWCTSYQPAIQDMMMVFETFSKPHLDPSERTGFWDKIRLIFHSRISLKWKNDGDVHLTLKGSRDPYKVTGEGAGLIFCLRGDVSWDIARDDDPKSFVQIEAEEFLLAIPDFNQQAREELDVVPSEDRSIASSSSYKEGALFKKVIMKLAGRVRFIIGLMFEQDLGGEGDWKTRKRSFEFKPHYEVTFKTPEHAKAPPGEVYDAFRGFRSHYIHLSISVISPIDRDWSIAGSKPSASYNTIHLTPKFFTHFYAWFSLFAGNMLLPIRQGPLWPGPEKTAKKFGRHLATIKYQLLLSPLFISHMYVHKLSDDSKKVAATGLKVKLDSFLVDMHMRREETTTAIKGLNLERKAFGMKFNQAELDFHSADIRAVSATIDEATVADLKQALDEPMSSAQGTIRFSGDLSQFTIPDSDYSWVDMDDFVELETVLPASKTPKTMILPLAFTPRFTYFRQTDHTGHDAPGSEQFSPFGHEYTHDCIISQNNDPREIQMGLVQSRLEKVHSQVNRNKQALDELAQEMKRRPEDEELKEESQKLIQQSSVLFDKISFLQKMLRQMSRKLDGSDAGSTSDQAENGENEKPCLDSELGFESSAFGDYTNDFDNRFIVHNMQAKWSNALRNIIIRYIHQVNQRRGFVYYMSRRAIKFILDIVEEQGHETYSESSPTSESRASATVSDTNSIESRLQQLLNDPVKFVVANEHLQESKSIHTETSIDKGDLTEDVSDEYLPLNSYHVRLIAPQIQLQSDKNKNAAVLVCTQGMQLKVISIMDKQRLSDEVSGLVQRRFSLTMDNTQFFVSHKRDFVSQSMWLHSANRYGTPTGTSWPPWVPLESMFDFDNNPVGFSRVVERTSATLRYDKHNSLRLKYSDQVNGQGDSASTIEGGPTTEVERRVDHVWVTFPKVKASCDSSQYYAMYIIVLDLLLYTEPTEKLRSEKLEKIMLASDFSDLRGAPEMVECLQNRIRQLEEIKNYFQVNARDLDDKGWEDSIALSNDLNNCEDELFFMMKAITTAQRRYEDKGSQSSGLLRWYISASEIIWHLLREQNEPLVDLQLTDAVYTRVDNSDGSNFNTVEIAMMRGYNQLPNAVYPEMIAPFFDHIRSTPAEVHQTKILRVCWNMLEAIAGIPIMDHFEVNLFPLKIQLEREIGDKIFQYIFPGIGSGTENEAGVSPFIVQNMRPIPPNNNGGGGDDGDDESSDSDDERPANSAMDDRNISSSDKNTLRPTLPQRPATSYSHRSSSTFFQSGYEKSIRSFMPSRTPITPVANDVPKGRRSNESTLTPNPQSFMNNNLAPEKKKRFFTRSPSHGQQDKPSDELSQMMSRASNYMTLAYIKIPSVVLCLSYKGRGDRNIEDIHEFVFRMPMLEYRNKTWSNLDLALRLKKDIIKALISHTGAILENKITHLRPNRQQPNLLRMMANNSTLGTSAPKLPDHILSDPTLAQSDFTALPGDPLTISRSSSNRISRSSTLASRSSTPAFYSGPSSTVTSSGNSTASDIHPPMMPSPGGEADRHGFGNTLSRHLSQLASHARQKEGIDGDTEESIKKKGRILLGKKMFGKD